VEEIGNMWTTIFFFFHKFALQTKLRKYIVKSLWLLWFT